MEKNIFGKTASLMIDRYRLVYLLIVILLFWGAISHGQLPKEVLPEVKFPYAIIMTEYPGASPQAVEKGITNKIESAVSGIGDIKKITSDSSQGLSIVTIKFEEGIDVKEKLIKIQTEINNKKSEFPEKSESSIIQEYDMNDFPIMLVNISGKYDLATIKDYALDIKNKINKVAGVKKVKVIGGKDREIQVITDPTILSRYQISTVDIKNAISNNNVDTPLGEKVLNDVNYAVKTNNTYKNIEDIERTIVGMRNGYPVFLKDVAAIEDTYKKQESFAVKVQNLDAKEDSVSQVVYLAIYKKKNTDTVKINEMIRDTIENSKGSLYPDSLNISYSSDMSKYINKSLNDVFGNAATGLLCVIIILFLFINFTESLIAAFVIPLSLLITVISFQYFNISYNVLSAMGLIMALGMLVDNAIVLIESINMKKQKAASIKEATRMAVNEVGPAICSSALTTIGALFPLAILSGDEGKLIRIIPIAAIVALIASFIVSITITPTLCTRFLKMRTAELSKRKKVLLIIMIAVISIFAFSNNGKLTILSFLGMILFSAGSYIKLFRNTYSISESVMSRYKEFLSEMITFRRKRRILFAVTALIFVISLIPLLTDILPKEAMPVTDNTTIYIDISLPKGSNLEDGKVLLGDIRQVLGSYKEIETYIAEVGKEKTSITVELVKKEKRKMHSKYIINSLSNDFKKIPGIKSKITNPDSEEEGAPISIELRGEDLKLLESYANEYKDILNGIKGVANTSISTEDGLPQFIIEYNKEKAAMLGLNPSEMDYELWQTLNSEKVSTLKNNNQEIDIRLRTSNLSFSKKEDFNHIFFSASEGSKVPFQSIATIKEAEGVDKIQHADNKRTIKILAENDPNVTINSIITEFKSKLKNSKHKPGEEVELNYTGYAEKMKESYSDMGNKMILAIIVVYAILVAQFNSFSQPFVILFSIPLAITGVVCGHLLVGIKFSTLSFMGMISLVGIVVNDAIVLIDYINLLRRNEGMAFHEAIVEAGKARFLPVIATSVTTIGGVLSLALYNEDYCQMAYTLIFGLCSSTVLILLIVPVAYFVMENTINHFANKNKTPL